MSILNNSDLCPCGIGYAYSDCCYPYISNAKRPNTPEQLMRSRYTAYQQLNIDYIAKTMKSPAADDFNIEEAREWSKTVHWIRLDVKNTHHDSKKGIVEFIAYYEVEDKQYRLHEISEFSFENERWSYVDRHRIPNSLMVEEKTKVGRNEICPCGSGKKFKKCCGA